MNCDEAFEALTDPKGQNDSALNWHLDFCPRCREMQQVLAPALAMFSGETEAADPAPQQAGPTPSHRLPAEFVESASNPPSRANENRRMSPPFLTPEAVRVAEQTAKSLHSESRRFAAHWQRFVAVGLLCVLAAWGFFYVTASSPKTAARRQPEPVMLADQCLWTDRNDNTQLTQTAEDASSRWVVLSCVACHLEQPLE